MNSVFWRRWRSGDALQVCRRVSMKVWSSGAAGVQIWKYGGIEVWSTAARCRRVDVEVWRVGNVLQACGYGGLETRCGCVDVWV